MKHLFFITTIICITLGHFYLLENEKFKYSKAKIKSKKRIEQIDQWIEYLEYTQIAPYDFKPDPNFKRDISREEIHKKIINLAK